VLRSVSSPESQLKGRQSGLFFCVACTGTFTQALYDEANKNGWTVISMKNDWKRIFAFD
jgi:hypothetical protein